VTFNNRRRDFTVRLGASSYRYPYTRLETQPAPGDHVVTAFVDPEPGREGFSTPSRLEPRALTLAAQQRLRTNTRKSVDEVLALLGVLECEVRLSVRAKSA
jgi:hypothetical protein